MKRMLTVLAMVLAATAVDLCQTGKVEQALTQMEHDWVDATAKADVATLGRILADDWAAPGTLGPTTKAEALAGIKSGAQKLDSITRGEMKKRVFADAAVVTGSDDEKLRKGTSGHSSGGQDRGGRASMLLRILAKSTSVPEGRRSFLRVF